MEGVKEKKSGGRRPGAGRPAKFGKGIKTRTVSFTVPEEKKAVIKEKIEKVLPEIIEEALRS